MLSSGNRARSSRRGRSPRHLPSEAPGFSNPYGGEPLMEIYDHVVPKGYCPQAKVIRLTTEPLGLHVR
jgi:hypothetical protein